jgi:hypothetical protein
VGVQVDEAQRKPSFGPEVGLITGV